MKTYIVIWKREEFVYSDPIEAKSAQEAADKIRETHVAAEVLLIGEVTKEEWK